MLVYISFGVIVRLVLATDLPSYIPRCRINDPNLNKCLIKASETLRPNLRKGLPELGIPQLDPLVIPEVTLQQGTDAINYKVTLINTTIHGFGNYVFTDFEYVPKRLLFHGTAAFDSLSVLSNYDIDGKVLAIPIYGNGVYRSYLGPSTGSLNITGELVKRNEVEYFEPKVIKAKITVSDFNGTFDGLFNGNEELSRATNKVLTENSKELFKEFLPAIEKLAEELIGTIMKGVARNVPYKKMFD